MCPLFIGVYVDDEGLGCVCAVRVCVCGEIQIAKKKVAFQKKYK